MRVLHGVGSLGLSSRMGVSVGVVQKVTQTVDFFFLLKLKIQAAETVWHLLFL